MFFIAGKSNAQILVQFHYTGWPDFGAPKCTEPIISLAKEVRKKVDHLGKKECTILVHCSAGGGRTGTFIALYQIMAQLEEIASISGRGTSGMSEKDWEEYYYPKTIDIFNTVLKLRSKRCQMVSISEQLIKTRKSSCSRCHFTNWLIIMLFSNFRFNLSPNTNIYTHAYRLMQRR